MSEPKQSPNAVRPLCLPSVDRRRFLAGSVAGAGLAVSMPWRGARASDAQQGGHMRVAIPPATTINPVTLDSSGGIAIVQQCVEYLVWAEGDLSLRPVLATDWQPSDGGRVWTFTLREGVRFHDGREMTAADVVATFQRLVEPDSASPAKGAMPFLQPEGIRQDGDYTVIFELDRPIGAFPYYTHTYNAAILPADYDGNFAENPVGTGPFRLTEYRPQELARFERNPEYWDAPRPYLDSVTLEIFDSPQPMILALQAGEVDVVQQLSFLDGQAIFDNPDIEVIEADAADHRALAMRTDQPPFDDKRVRQAVALCFDRGSMVDGLLGGRADIGNDHPIAPIYPEDVDIDQRAANHEQARALLAEAGYPDGFEIDLHTHQYLELPQYATLAQEMLAPAGIRVNLQVEPTNVYYGHWTEVPFGLTDWTSRPTAAQILAQAYQSTAEWNAAHWDNAEFDELLAEFEAEPDLDRRSEIGTRIAEIMNDEVPAVIAYFNRNLRASAPHVRDLEGSMSNYLDLSAVWLEED